MRNDEFNKVEITNDKQIRWVEYGKIQKTEYSRFSGNPDVVKSDLNETKTKNDDVSENKIEKPKTSHQIVDSDKIKTITTASTGVVAAASVVTIVTISTLVGINLFNAKCEFKNLEVTEYSIVYELELTNSLNDNYKIWVEGNFVYDENRPEYSDFPDGYLSYYDLQEGTNTGEFYDLMPDTEYTITVKKEPLVDEKIENTVIYTTTVRTKPYESSSYAGIIMPLDADFDTNSFDLQVYYYDEKGLIDNLALTMTDQFGDFSRTYPLEKIDGTQTICGDEIEGDPDTPLQSFNEHLRYDYVFSYDYEGERIEEQTGSVEFYDKNGEVMGLYNFNREANFLDNSFDIQLDYYDPNGRFTDFYIEISDTLETHDYPINEVSTVQTISGYVDGEKLFDFSDPNKLFDISLFATDSNQADPIMFDHYAEVKFTDTSGASPSEFGGVYISPTADLSSNVIDVTLSYVDELDHFDRIYLDVTAGNIFTQFELEKTTETQQIALVDRTGAPIILRTHSLISYELSYYDCGNLVQDQSFSGEVQLEDIYNRVTEFNGVNIESAADFENGEFYITLGYVDDFNAISEEGLTITLYYEDSATGDTVSYTYDLTKTTDRQTITIDFDESPIYEGIEYTYYISYVDVDKGEDSYVPDNNTITFTNI